MSVLLGVELAGPHATLTVVDRHGEVLATEVQELESPVSEWPRTHPEVYFRAVSQLLVDATRGGLVDPQRVAAIGLAVDPGVVLLDAELNVIAPRQLEWSDALDGAKDLRESLERLSESARFARVGVFFSLLDFVRYRMTGAIASHESFVVCNRFARSPAARTEWNTEAFQELGLRPDALPPVFDASWKVGIVGPDLGGQVGLGRNVWVGGGSDPLSARLLTAVEPVPDTRVLWLGESGESNSVWRVGPAPTDFGDEYRGQDFRPLPLVSKWYHRDRALEATLTDPRGDTAWVAPEGQWTIDTSCKLRAADWKHAPEGDVWFAWDCGHAGAGAGIQAGLGIGWWRDLRGLWRKRRAPIDHEDWYNSFDEPAEDGASSEGGASS